MIKKILLLMLVIGLLFVPMISDSANQCSGYADVSDNTWYCNYLKHFQDEGILDKKSHFQPSSNINLAEALKTIYQTSGERLVDNPAKLLNINRKWYAKYFKTAYSMKLIRSEDFSFNPGLHVNKAEFVILFMMAFDLPRGGDVSCLEGKIGTGNWINLTNIQKVQYLCKAKELGVANDINDRLIDRATAMAVLYKGIYNTP